MAILDKIPINNEKFQFKLAPFHFKSNKYSQLFVKQGIPPHRLVAAGFGETILLVKKKMRNHIEKIEELK